MNICSDYNCVLSSALGYANDNQIWTPFVERQEIETAIMTILMLLVHEW